MEVTIMNNVNNFYQIEPWRSVRSLKMSLLGLN